MNQLTDLAVAETSQFFEYQLFEGNGPYREQQRDDFVAAKIWVPEYDYPKLATLRDEVEETSLVAYKSDLLQSVFSLESAKQMGQVDPSIATLYADFYEYQLKKLLLAEAAQSMRTAGDGEQHRTLRESFMALNREIYGDMDRPTWLGMMNAEKQRLDVFEPANDQAASVKAELAQVLAGVEVAQPEAPLVTPELIAMYRPLIEERYADILAEIPDTEDDQYYNADACAEIINRTLMKGGLTGWQCEVHPTKTVPDTVASKQRIYLPQNTRRNAAELRRLVIHEQEVHARRAFNGAQHPELPILAAGTATYADVEEGLGVLLEIIIAGTPDNPSLHRARDRYILTGLALGLDRPTAAPRDARQTYETMWRLLAIRKATDGILTEAAIHQAKREATTHIENAFRGTVFAAPGVIYSKLKMYYEGLAKNVARLTEINGDVQVFERQFIGKINHTDPDEEALVLGIIS